MYQGPSDLIGTHAPRLSWMWVFLVPLIGVCLLMTAYPVAMIFLKSFALSRPGYPVTWGFQGWIDAFSDRSLVPVLTNTFSLAALRIVISSVLAIFFSWVVTRTDTPYKHFIEFALWFGFFLPLLPMTMGWILLLDSHYGLLNRAAIRIFNLTAAPFNIFSYWGIIWCHLAFSTSVRFLLMTPAFRAMDAVLEEAARASGSNTLGTLLRITIPILAPAILASTALGFIRSLESFEIELVLGVPAGIYVLPTRIYDFLRWEPPLYSQATALSSIFLVVIFALIWIQKVLLGTRQYTTITGRGYQVRPQSLGSWRWVTFAICMLFIGVMILLPLATLLMGTFMEVFGFFDLVKVWTTRHWTAAFNDPIFLRSLTNTVTLGLGASILGTLFYLLISYAIVRTQLPGRKLIDILSWLPWALPGVLISLALLWVVLGSGGVLRPLYGTIFLLVLAMIIKEMPLGSQIIKASVLQISKELEEASDTSGASWVTTFRRIIIPLLTPTLSAVGIIVFIAAVREIPAVVFLSTNKSRTISLLMLDSIAEANMEKAAVIGFFIVFLVLILLLIARFLGSRLRDY
jgi:iron(III) transport system permease protein